MFSTFILKGFGVVLEYQHLNTRTTKGGQNDLFNMLEGRYTSIVGSSSVNVFLN